MPTRQKSVAGLCLAGLLLFVPQISRSENASEGTRASRYLAQTQDRFHTTFDVYTDADAAGNHFVARGQMSSLGDEDAVPPMVESFPDQPHSGLTCIKARFLAQGANWGGWYLMNGVLRGSEVAPRPNWGHERNAGVDLTGATTLSFWARGERGGERVNFICLGVGRDPVTGWPDMTYPGSSRTKSTGFVTLSRNWREYTIDVRGSDLSYVLGGFGWVTDSTTNGGRDITFYLDDIRYDKPRLDEPRFLLSYETIASNNDFDTVMRNVAFTYDTAVALHAFLAVGDMRRARLIADALYYAWKNDRYYREGRIRNAYQAGDLALPDGWTPHGYRATVRMPGWYDATHEHWFEDEFQVSTHTGNVAWAMLALLSYYETAGGADYLTTAVQMGEWVEEHCRDERGAGGYTGGYQGWGPTPEGSIKLLYKSTEHNLDLYSAFLRLFLLTTEREWLDRAGHAKRFLLSMWDDADGKFWTGTHPDGVTTNTDVIPLDPQTWGTLALGDVFPDVTRSLEYAESHLNVRAGFDFNQDGDGIWYEGTAQMAVAYKATGQESKAQALIGHLHGDQLPSGALYAADPDGITTGFTNIDGTPWLYFKRPHVGATAWLVLAEYGLNPFDHQPTMPRAAAVHAASFERTAIAPEAIVAVFGNGLSAATAEAPDVPLPTELAGATVTVRDAAGVDRLASLIFVSPGQINCVAPANLSPGPAVVTVSNDGEPVAVGLVEVSPAAPGLFSAGGDGQGLAAALCLTVSGDGTQSTQPVAHCDASGVCMPIPCEVAEDPAQTYLILFGTGIRGHGSVGNVTVTVGGVEVPVVYAGDQQQFPGLDQVNIGPMPGDLRGRGDIEIQLRIQFRAGHLPANPVTVAFR